MQVVGPRACDQIYFASGATSLFRQIVRTQNLELSKSIDAGIVQQGKVGSAIEVVGAINGPIVLCRPVAVDREVHLVGQPSWAGGADIKLIGSQVRRDSRRKRNQLRKVAGVDGQFADLRACDQSSRGGGVEINLSLRLLNLDGLRRSADLELGVHDSAVADVEHNVICNILLKAGCVYHYLITSDRKSGSNIRSVTSSGNSSFSSATIGVDDLYGRAGHDRTTRVL